MTTQEHQEIVKLAVAGFELREGRLPTADETKVLEKSAEMFYEKNALSGCAINYACYS